MKSSQRSAERNTRPGGGIVAVLDQARGSGNAETLASVATVLQMIELLAASPRPLALTAVARTLGLSKPRAWRNLRTLVAHGYARQDADTDRYEIGSKLMTLGEAVRDRFSVVGAARQEMASLRDQTGHAVTLTALVDGAVTVLEMLQGRTMIEFGFRASSALPMQASAHGHVTLAFGDPRLLKALDASAALRRTIAAVRRQGWATAADQVLVGVNALAAPIRDHRGALAGAVAIVGAGTFIAAQPTREQIALVTAAAARISRRLGWGVD